MQIQGMRDNNGKSRGVQTQGMGESEDHNIKYNRNEIVDIHFVHSLLYVTLCYSMLH